MNFRAIQNTGWVECPSEWENNTSVKKIYSVELPFHRAHFLLTEETEENLLRKLEWTREVEIEDVFWRGKTQETSRLWLRKRADPRCSEPQWRLVESYDLQDRAIGYTEYVGPDKVCTFLREHLAFEFVLVPEIIIKFFSPLGSICFYRNEFHSEIYSLNLDCVHERLVTILTVTVPSAHIDPVKKLLESFSLRQECPSKITWLLEADKASLEKYGPEIDEMREKLHLSWGDIESLLKDMPRESWMIFLRQEVNDWEENPSLLRFLFDRKKSGPPDQLYL